MKRILPTLLALTPALLSPAVLVGEENWPNFRGPRHDNRAPEADVPVTWSESSNVAWKTPLPGRGWSSPVVWGKRIWMTTATEDGKQMSVLCVDLETGKLLRDQLLFENEEPRFCHEMNSYASPTPVVEDGRVYAHFGSYGTACLDADTGKVLWQRRDLPCDHFRGPGSSPVAYRDTLIIHYDGFDFQYVVALDKKTGRTVWKTDRDIDYGTDNGDIFKAYCTPLVVTIDGQDQLISPASKATLAYDPSTGEEIWRVRYGGFSATAQPLFDGQRLYLNTGFSKADMLAVRPGGKGDITDTHVLWTVKKTIGSKPSQVLWEGRIYNVSDKGIASCIDAKSGKELWSERLKGQFSSSLLLAGGRIYLFNHEGQAWVLKPGDTFEAEAVNKLDDGCLASPAVVGNTLLVRTKTHLYALRK